MLELLPNEEPRKNKPIWQPQPTQTDNETNKKNNEFLLLQATVMSQSTESGWVVDGYRVSE
jgi:hypothetical protein